MGDSTYEGIAVANALQPWLRSQADGALSARNLERPLSEMPPHLAEKARARSELTDPEYAPEWYAVYDFLTAVQEGLVEAVTYALVQGEAERLIADQ